MKNSLNTLKSIILDCSLTLIIFCIIDSSGEFASKRDIRAGRRNNRFLEIQEGLQEGEMVITSSYNQMADIERIVL